MRTFIPVALLLVAAACDLSSTEPETRNQADEFPLRRTWTASIAGMNGSGLTGSLEVRDETIQYTAELTIANGPASTTLDWRIYPGTCANSSDDVQGGSTQAFPDFTTDESGAVSLVRVLAAGLGLTPGEAYNVRIMTGNNIDTTIACGELAS